MQSIGERLEEARKRRGISVREAAEATKIRGDFLLKFENNEFDIGLPELYVRGFLRNYSAFLKIDGDKLVTDFTAALIGESRSNRKEPREFLGRIEIPERARPAPPTGQASGVNTPGTRKRAEEAVETSARNERDGSFSPQMKQYAIIGGVILLGIICILLIVVLIKWLGQETPGSSRGDPEPSTQNQPALPTLTVFAKDSVSVQVKLQSAAGTRLFEGTLSKGEVKTFTISEPVWLIYNPGRNIEFQRSGQQRSKPQSDGLGRISIQ